MLSAASTGVKTLQANDKDYKACYTGQDYTTTLCCIVAPVQVDGGAAKKGYRAVI